MAMRARLLLLALTAALFGSAMLAQVASAKPVFHDTLTCESVTYNWTGFGEGEHAMTLKVKVDGQTRPYVYEARYHFTGDAGSVTVPVAIPAGVHSVTAYAEYEGAESDYRLPPIECGPNPAISIEKLQEVSGSGSGYTTAEIVTNPAQSLSYKFLVKNTGNQPLTHVTVSDANCEAGSITGGPSTIAPGATATFYCTRLLGGVGVYTNTAQVSASPEGGGEPVSTGSNEVVARVVLAPSISIEKLQEIAGSGHGFTKEELAANVGQTVNYKILVKNTGELPVTLSALKDAHCGKGTLTGGPGANPLAPGETTTYTCSYTFTKADSGRVYANAAGVTATSEGGSVTDGSNTVLVEVPVPKPVVKHVVTCNSITVTLTGFPQRPGNQVVIKVKIDGQTKPYAYEQHVTFNGATTTVVLPVSIPAGHHEVTVYVEWIHNGNGLPPGESDWNLKGGITCPFIGSLTAEKSQRIQGGEHGFQTTTLTAFTGETIEYQVVVTNSTNAPLTLGALSDEGCDGGTISGGPGASPLAIGASTTYTCTRLLSGAGPWTNTASIKGTPPPEVGSSLTATSNTVNAETPI